MANINYSDRGFVYLDKISCAYGGYVSVRESSSAMEPMIWLTTEEPNDINAWMAGDESGGLNEATVHLTAEQAWELKQNLEQILEHHYHGDARPGYGE